MLIPVIAHRQIHDYFELKNIEKIIVLGLLRDRALS